MPAAMPPPAPRVPPLSGTWTIEQRRFLGMVGGALCLGIIIGAKIGRGTFVPVPEEVRIVQGPCADCAERAIQEQRRATSSAPGGRPLPGDVPPVQFTPPTGVGAASTDISGMPTDTSKSHVVDPTFIAGEG